MTHRDRAESARAVSEANAIAKRSEAYAAEDAT
jgi:hypothetical protein